MSEKYYKFNKQQVETLLRLSAVKHRETELTFEEIADRLLFDKQPLPETETIELIKGKVSLNNYGYIQVGSIWIDNFDLWEKLQGKSIILEAKIIEEK